MSSTAQNYVGRPWALVAFVLTLSLIPAADAEQRTCLSHTDCERQIGETCLNGLCRSANDHRVERLFTIAIAPIYDLTPERDGSKLAEEATHILEGLLKSTVFFDTLAPSQAPATAMLEGWMGSTILFQSWSGKGAYALVKGTLRESEQRESLLTLQLFLVESGARLYSLDFQAFVTAETLREQLIGWADKIVHEFAGRPGILGTQIAFAKQTIRGGAKEIYVTGLDGVEERAVTSNGNLNLLPSWGPMGVHVAYTSYQDRNPDLFIAGKKFSGHPNLNMGAEWSPDGSEVALSLSKDGNNEIYVLDGETGEVKRRLTNHPSIDSSPSWSPDGKRIVFVSDRTGSPQLFIMDRYGQNVRHLKTRRNYSTSPEWSPIGSMVVFNAMGAGGRFDLFMIDVETEQIRQLTYGSGSNEDPSWSPDARYLVFASTRGSRPQKKRRQLYVMAANGGNATRITRREALYSSPAWSPR